MKKKRGGGGREGKKGKRKKVDCLLHSPSTPPGAAAEGRGGVSPVLMLGASIRQLRGPSPGPERLRPGGSRRVAPRTRGHRAPLLLPPHRDPQPAAASDPRGEPGPRGAPPGTPPALGPAGRVGGRESVCSVAPPGSPPPWLPGGPPCWTSFGDLPGGLGVAPSSCVCPPSPQAPRDSALRRGVRDAPGTGPAAAPGGIGGGGRAISLSPPPPGPPRAGGFAQRLRRRGRCLHQRLCHTHTKPKA